MDCSRAIAFLASLSLFAACDDVGASPSTDGATGSSTGEAAETSDSPGDGSGSGSNGGSGPSTAGSSDGPETTGQDETTSEDGGSSSGDATTTTGSTDVSPRTLAIGDSVFEWNAEDGASIPDFAAQAASLEMTNAAVGGAMVLGDKEESIPGQYYDDDWGRVLIDGGANDLGDGCGCGNCLGVVDELISEDLSSGAMVDLIQRIRSDGAEVVLMGYYTVSEKSEFGECDEEFEVMHARYEALAQQTPGVLFVSAADVMRWADNPEYYAEDLIHPAPEGSEAVGLYIGQQIAGP